MQPSASFVRRAVFAFVVMTRASAARADEQRTPPPAEPENIPSYCRASFGALPAELPISLAETQILVDGIKVNGQGPFRFLLDTGAMGGGRVDSSLATRLGLKPVGEAQGTDGSERGGQAMPIYRLDSLAVGPLTFHDVEVLSRDYNAQGAAIRGHIDGVLGFQLFREVLLTIDYAGGKVVLAQGELPEADAKTILQLSDKSIPTITVKISGEAHSAHIDTGSMGGVSVGSAAAEGLTFVSAPKPVGEARTVSGAFPISAAQLSGAVTIGEHTIDQPELTIGAPLRDVNLGGRFLQAFTMTFDQHNRRVRFERSGEATVGARIPGKVITTATLEMQMGRPVVSVLLNGKGPFPMILDTGAGVTVFNTDLVDELDIPSTGTTRIGDPTEPEAIEAKTHVIDSVQLGDVTTSKIAAVSWPDDSISGALGNVRGVLGLAAFAGHLVTFDFPGERLILSKGTLGDGDGSVGWSGDDPIPTLELSVAGQRIPAHLDTGNADDVSLPNSFKEQVKFVGTPVEARARTASGEFPITIGRIEGTIEFGGQVVRGPEVHFTERFAQGNIGSGALAGFIVTVDSATRRVLVQPGNRLAASIDTVEKPRKRYGVIMAMASAGPLVVSGVAPGSIAERTGLMAGDRIVRLNGQDAAALDAAARGAAMRTSPLALVVERDGKQLEIKMSLEDDASTSGAGDGERR